MVRTLLRDVKTRWNSTLEMLERALAMKVYIRHWVVEFPQYAPVLLTEDEWIIIGQVMAVLAPFRLCTLWAQTTKSITIHRSLDIYALLVTHIEAQIPKVPADGLPWERALRRALEQAAVYARVLYENLDSRNLDEHDRPMLTTRDGRQRKMGQQDDIMIGLASVLDPYRRLRTFKSMDAADARGRAEEQGIPVEELEPIPFENTWVSKYTNRIMEYWNTHYKANIAVPEPEDNPRRDILMSLLDESDSENEDGGDSTQALEESIKAYLSGSAGKEVRLKDSDQDIPIPWRGGAYMRLQKRQDIGLNERDVLGWWKRHQFDPELVALVPLARDVLAIPASAVGCEQAFSTGRDVCHYRRYFYQIFYQECLMCLIDQCLEAKPLRR